MEIDALLASGTDGEKASANGLARNFYFAMFLDSFIHLKHKGRIEEHGVSLLSQKHYQPEIFGWQEETAK